MTQYKVIISQKSNEMLKEHIAFLAQVDKNSATNAKENLINSLKTLETMPLKYPFFNEEYITKNKYHKMYVEKWHLVLYQIKDNTVFVDYILDCRKEYEWLV